MKTFTLRTQFFSRFVTTAIIMHIVSVLPAQVVRPYTNIYSATIRGGHTIIGNTLTAIYTSGSGSTGIVNTTAMNDFSTSGTGNYTFGRTSAYDNNSSNIQFVDIDGTGNPTVNSSSANLVLPAGTNTIKFARLYWGGRILSADSGAGNINLRNAKIKFNSESYQSITAAPAAIDKSLINGTDYAYQAYFDVTAYVNIRGSGTYTMADVTAATGSNSTGGGGYFAGWVLVLVYENATLPYTSVRVYDGFLMVYNNGVATSQSITLNGLNPPSAFSLSSDAYMSLVAWEGDADLAASATSPNGDFVKVNSIAAANAVNPATNFWNGTISNNGAHLSGAKSPDFKNQMAIDIDQMDVGTGYNITPATTNVNIEFGTEADQYFPSIFCFTMKTKPPLVQINKIVKDTAAGNAPWQIPNGLINPNEILTYTITGKNTGSGNAINCVITDSIPVGLTYRPGSLKVNAPTPGITAGFKTDAGSDDAAYKSKNGSKEYVQFFIGTGATSSAGGTLAPADSFSIQFQCIVPSNPSAINFVSNTARITGTEQDGVTPFVNDGTAIIGPPAIGLPVKMTDFTVQNENGEAVLRWTTVSETGTDHYEIERSIDGVNFNTAGTIQGNGTTTDTKNYQYNDPVDISENIIYYRLKIVDVDAHFTYSKIIALRLHGLAVLKNFTVYPSPFTNEVKLQFNSARETKVTIRITSMAGQEEVNYNTTAQPGENIVVLSNLDALKPGAHLMEIISEDGKFTQKLIKQ